MMPQQRIRIFAYCALAVLAAALIGILLTSGASLSHASASAQDQLWQEIPSDSLNTLSANRQSSQQFDGQTINWTAAACNATVGCSYQPAHRQLTLGPSAPQEPNPTPSVLCVDGANEVEIRNGLYRARISKATGAFTVKRLTGGGAEESAASADSISSCAPLQRTAQSQQV